MRSRLAARVSVAWALLSLVWQGVVLPAAHGDPLSGPTTLVAWSEFGMWETDGSDYSVYSIGPPYSTLRAQLVNGGKLVTNAAGVGVTYEAVADATGSINTTSQGKGNFYQFAQALYGTGLAPDQGLAGFGMPGPANTPQAMAFDVAQRWFTATGIPITPYDDQGRKNHYPLMHVVARDSAGNLLATTDVALPVTDEMNCRVCHASGTQTAARPYGGWVWEVDAERDYKLNVLHNHDDHFNGSSVYSNVLAQVGYNTAGLVPTVTQSGQPVSCLRCHSSTALPGSGVAGMRPLTQLMHTKHAFVAHPTVLQPLTLVTNSGTCLLCHGGTEATYLRGAHHNAIGADGSPAMQCQSCHGSMTALGAAPRQGWLDEPNCQSCHTGTAAQNAGQLRYTNAFDTSGQFRPAVNLTFATQSNTPSAGLGLFRHSEGHGGLKCAACHGAPHAELASSEPNDNRQSQLLQGHAGTLADCSACHPSVPGSSNGGPHGLHPLDQTWAHNHETQGQTECTACHGTDYRGTALSWALGDRAFGAPGVGGFWHGFQIGCYNCHNGPGGGENGGGTGNTPPVASDVSAATPAGIPVQVRLQATDSDGNALSYRAASQPAHGTVWVDGNVATFFPGGDYEGSDSFTYAAWDGSTDSNLGTVSVTTTPGDCALTANAIAPTAAHPGATVPFRASASRSPCRNDLAYDWDFGDGGSHGTGASVAHQYAAAGDYTWTLTVTAAGASPPGDAARVTGLVTISPTLGPLLPLTISAANYMLQLSWPLDRIPVALESSAEPMQPNSWQPVPDPPVIGQSNVSVQVFMLPDPQYFRLHRVP